jgi:dCTP deaminase (EC 3.5.4.13)
MGLKSDRWIKEMALKGMIEPFIDHLVTGGVISYGLSSYGYDMRIANEFKVFTGSYSKENAIVDPKNFDKDLLQDYVGDFVIIPPNSYVLGRSVEYFRIPRNVHCIVLGKSTYARSGIIVNITPLEACYDEDTEILTLEGWKKFKDLKDDEIVATLNPNTNELEYQKIVKKQKFEHNLYTLYTYKK